MHARSQAPGPHDAARAATTADPYLWLEDVDGERALAWVRERNAQSTRSLEAEPGFATLRDGIREILDSKGQIPHVQRRGGHLYNLWRDAGHPRGLWRRTTLAEFRRDEPAWEGLIDLDALARDEGENWVWAGVDCLGPAYTRCLVELSRGGADATVVREFDLATRRFVDGGFTLPEAKSSVTWADADSVYVGTDVGPGSMTASGYPRVIRHWRRGQPLADAPTVFEGEATDVSAWVAVDRTPGFERTLFGRQLDFYRNRVWLRADDGTLQPVAKPEDASLDLWREHALLSLRSDWRDGERAWPQGSLLVAPAADALAGTARWQALFTPTATRSLAGYATTRRHVVLEVLDNVASRVEEWQLHDGGWTRREATTPFPGTSSVQALHDPMLADDPLAEAVLLHYADFLTPDRMLLGRTGSDEREVLKSRPSFFDATAMQVSQHAATSADGTRVPYFVVQPRNDRQDGPRPTLLYGYGGFEVSMQPSYSGSVGRAWLARGGVYVLANIRGGGEFGPGWHQAAVGANRQRAFDDFAAVAEDLVRRGLTEPARLGIMGGSNGGLLVGSVMLQRPELLGAVVCQVPLLDMHRYHKLLAGASWVAEYGDPDNPAQRAWVEHYSPYQRVRQDMTLPPVLFTTSTRDDRVHPGHARKMAARMLAQGHDVLYYENIEGGHGGAADNAQRARLLALEYSFLWRALARGAHTAP